jgi:hypothetical protein
MSNFVPISFLETTGDEMDDDLFDDSKETEIFEDDTDCPDKFEEVDEMLELTVLLLLLLLLLR